MLKHIPKSFTPELLEILMAMGHGEEILISDGNFPALTFKDTPKIYIPTNNIVGLLEDILKFFPLDTFVDEAAICMQSVTEGASYEPYKKLIEANNSKIKLVERFAFYDCVEKVVGIIVTADTTKGGNILIKKGVVKDNDIDL